jgi:hypothetical protein
MLCGASDIADIKNVFYAVIKSLCFAPISYLDGELKYENGKWETFDSISKGTVIDSDFCVFVVLKKFGEITARIEWAEAYNSNNKPYLIFVEESILEDFWNKKLKDKNLKKLFTSVEEKEDILISFKQSNFKQKLKSQIQSYLGNILTAYMNKKYIAAEYVLPAIAFGAFPYLHPDTKVDQYVRVVVVEFKRKYRKTIVQYGGNPESKRYTNNYGVVGVMLKEKNVIFYDFHNGICYMKMTNNDIVTKNTNEQGEANGRRALLAAPIYRNENIIAALTYDFYKSPTDEKNDIINRVNDHFFFNSLLLTAEQQTKVIYKLLYS